MATLTQVRETTRFLEGSSRSRMLAAEAARVMPAGITRETIRRQPYAPAMASAHGSVLLDADGDERTGHRRVRWADPRGLDGPGHTNARRQVTASGASVRATSAGLAPPGIAGPFPLPGIYLWPRRMAAPDHHRPFPSRGRLVVLVAVVLVA